MCNGSVKICASALFCVRTWVRGVVLPQLRMRAVKSGMRIGLKRVCESREETADLSTALRSGRDDKFVARKLPIIQWMHARPSLNKFVISTGAKRRFPASRHSQLPRMRLSLKESRMKFTSATKFNRKSGGAERRDLRFLFRFSHPSPKPLPRGLLSKDRFPLPARGDQSHAVLHP
jgi:hypothetical protein